MIVDLSIGKVEVLDKITWGMQEALRTAMLSGVKVKGITEADLQKMELDASIIGTTRYKLLEMCVKKITLNDGKEIAYSKQWMDELCIEDGDKLFNAVNDISKPIKK